MNKHAKLVKWDEYNIGHLTLPVPLLSRDVPFELMVTKTPPVVSPKMWRAVEQVLALPQTDIAKVADLLWEEANFAFTVVDFGVQAREGETALQAHLRAFGVVNPQDALKKATVKAVQILQENDEFDGLYAEIQINTVTDSMISIIIKDGVIVDFDDDGCWLGDYDDNPNEARDARKAVLAAR
jgi:hypothetical protein